MVKIALLIPCYNSAKTITDTLESLLVQEGIKQVFSILIADDGSVDDTLSIVHSFIQGHPELPFVVLSNVKNTGQWKNKNRAVQQFLGQKVDWVFILHGDDIAKPQWLSLYLDQINQGKTQMGSICSSWDDWYPAQMPEAILQQKKMETYGAFQIECIGAEPAAVSNTLRKGCWWHISGAAINMAALRQIGSFQEDLPYMSDYEFLLRMLHSGWDIVYIPLPLIVYRVHVGSVASVSLIKDFDFFESLQVMQKYRAYLTSPLLLYRWRRQQVASIRRCGRAISRLDWKLAMIKFRNLLVLNLLYSRLATQVLFTKSRIK